MGIGDLGNGPPLDPKVVEKLQRALAGVPHIEFPRIDVLLGPVQWPEAQRRRIAQAFAELGAIGNQAIADLWSPAIETALETMGDMTRMMASLKDALAPFERATERVFPELAKRGWYLGLSTDAQFMFTVERMLEEPNEAAIEDFVVKEARNSAEAMLEAVIGAAPQRERLLVGAWERHRERDYNSSVPVLLAQADGIAFDLFGGLLFLKGPPVAGATTRPTRAGMAISAKISDADSALLGVLLEPIHHGGCIAASESHLESLRAQNPAFGRLNRHEVMHGRAIDYGTEANSLRVMVLLECLVSIAEHIDRKS